MKAVEVAQLLVVAFDVGEAVWGDPEVVGRCMRDMLAVIEERRKGERTRMRGED